MAILRTLKKILFLIQQTLRTERSRPLSASQELIKIAQRYQRVKGRAWANKRKNWLSQIGQVNRMSRLFVWYYVIFIWVRILDYFIGINNIACSAPRSAQPSPARRDCSLSAPSSLILRCSPVLPVFHGLRSIRRFWSGRLCWKGWSFWTSPPRCSWWCCSRRSGQFRRKF